MQPFAIADAFNARAHWAAVYRRAWLCGRLDRVLALPPVVAAPVVALDGERDLTRVRFLRHRRCLQRDDIDGYRRWVNRDGIALYALQELDATHNDLDDANPLYWGHVSHVADGHAVWVTALVVGGRHAGDLVLQLDARGQRVVALHDLRVFVTGQGDGEAVVSALLASTNPPVKVVQAQAGAPAFWSRMGGNGFFDHYGNVNLSWEAYAHRRLDMPVGASAHWQALYARDDAEAWADPVARARRLRILQHAAARGRRQPPPAAE